MTARSIKGLGNGCCGWVVLTNTVCMPALRPNSISLILLPTINDLWSSMAGKSSLLRRGHAGIRLAVGMVVVEGGTIVYFVNTAAGSCYILQHAGMYLLQVCFCHQSFTNTFWLVAMRIRSNRAVRSFKASSTPS